MKKVTRPILRHFGGKWQLKNWILPHLHPHQFYAEPFAGAASVLLAKDPAPGGEIINDLNRDIVNLFSVMRDKDLGDELERVLSWTPYAQVELQNSREHTDDPVERARRMLVRSFMGIEVAGTTGSASGFRMGNVDLGRLDKGGKRTFRNCAKDWSNWKEAVGAIRERLANVMIYEKDALEFIRLMDSSETLLYIDPPYHHETRSGTRYAVEFTAHEELINTILTCKSKVVLSGYDCPEYSILEDVGYTKISKDYRANMSLTRRTECLWVSPK